MVTNPSNSTGRLILVTFGGLPHDLFMRLYTLMIYYVILVSVYYFR